MFNIGEKIVNLRKENNLTQDELANKLNVSRQSISKWESGLSLPEISNLLLISEIFNCTIDSLLLEETTPLEVPKESFETFGERLIYLRKKHHMSQELLAEALFVSRQAIFKYEKNLIYPDLDNIIKISKMYNCSMDYLLKKKFSIKNKTVENVKQTDERKSIKFSFITDHIFNILFLLILIISRILLSIPNNLGITLEYVLITVFPLIFIGRFVLLSIVYREKRFTKEINILITSITLYIPLLSFRYTKFSLLHYSYLSHLPTGLFVYCLLNALLSNNKAKSICLSLYFGILGSIPLYFYYIYREYYFLLYEMIGKYMKIITIILLIVYVLWNISKIIEVGVKKNKLISKIFNIGWNLLTLTIVIILSISLLNTDFHRNNASMAGKIVGYYIILMTIFSLFLSFKFEKRRILK